MSRFQSKRRANVWGYLQLQLKLFRLRQVGQTVQIGAGIHVGAPDLLEHVRGDVLATGGVALDVGFGAA
jgi:hypothetical protein